MSDIVLPSDRGIIVASLASVVEEDKTIDEWTNAHKEMVPRPDFGWIRSNFVDLSPPEDLRPNENGHVFLLADGEASYEMIRDTPQNWLHHEQLIVGHYVDVHLEHHEATRLGAAALPPGAHIETFSVFYRGIYPRQWNKVTDAHAAGGLFSSMEARPKRITCMTDGCCGETFPFITAWHDSYCKGLKIADRKFIAHEPAWLGGAVVVPPHRPGWKGASAIEVATYIEQHRDEAESLYRQIAATHEGITDEQAEAILVALLEAAGAGDGNGGRSRVSMTGAGSNFEFRLPDDIQLPTAYQVRQLLSPRRTAHLEAQANNEGVIIAAVPPPEVAAALAALGDEPVEQIHVTLAFIGDSMGNDEIDTADGPLTLERLNAVVAVFAASERPIPARVSGLGRFSLSAGNEVTYASIDAPGLNEFRARLVEYLDAAGAAPSMDHGFTPHATVQYHRAGEGPTDLPEGLEWEIDAIELWWGDAFHDAHSLGGVGDFDTMAATLAIDAIAEIDPGAGSTEQIETALASFTAAARVETLRSILEADQGHPRVLAALYEALIDRAFSRSERSELAEKGQAMPDGSFPTPTRADWMNARAAIGRADPEDRSKVIAYLKRRAKALGIPDEEIPDTW